MKFVLQLILALAFLNAVLIYQVYQALPLAELRRRARSGKSKKAQNLYKLMAFGPSLELMLWLKATLSALIIIVWVANSWWSGLLAGLAISAFACFSFRRRPLPGWVMNYAAAVAPFGSAAMGFLQPVIAKPARAICGTHQPHTALYETDDLTNLLKRQVRQPDNRISEADLQTAHAALNFSGRTVGQAMTPRAKAAWVAAGEPVGPALMDELHKTGQTRFAVVKEDSKAAALDVIGSLYLPDLLEKLDKGGRVKDIMQPGAATIDETASLREALEQILKTNHHLLIVTNSFEETAGVLTLENILAQLTGHKFTNHRAEPAGLPADERVNTPDKTDKKV